MTGRRRLVAFAVGRRAAPLESRIGLFENAAVPTQARRGLLTVESVPAQDGSPVACDPDAVAADHWLAVAEVRVLQHGTVGCATSDGGSKAMEAEADDERDQESQIS